MPLTGFFKKVKYGGGDNLIPVPDLKATNSFSRICDSGDLLRISSRLIQIWYNTFFETDSTRFGPERRKTPVLQ